LENVEQVEVIKGTEKDFEGFMPYSIVVIKDGCTIARRVWIEEPHIETKSEEQQPLPSTRDMIPAKDLPKIKLDVKKPIFNIYDNKEVKFIYSNKREYVFEDHQGLILVTMNEYLDSNYYNKPDVKTTEQLISDAWTYACNAGSLWASPTQLFYMAIEQLVKDGVVDMNKVYEVKQ
jgi:hypothetical protein